MYLMSKHLESDVKNKKKEKLWKSELLRSRNANDRQRCTFFSRATVFACPITPNVSEPLANFFRHRLVGDVFFFSC